MAFGLSAGAVSLIGMGAGALLGGGGGGSQQSGNATTTVQQQLDPRIAGAIFGSGQRTLKPGVQAQYANGQPEYDPETHRMTGGGMTNPDSDYTTDGGLLGRYTGMLDTPQSPGMQQYGQDAQRYLAGNGAGSMLGMNQAANKLMAGNLTAPKMDAAYMEGLPSMRAATVANPGSMQSTTVAPVGPMRGALTDAATVNAPSQNGLNLTGAYSNMISGDAGANPYLTRALGSAVGQTNASYERNQTSATDNLLRNILPSIRSGAMAVGGYGGSRQGIAEGNAIGDFAKSMDNSNLQLGLANSANTTGQQATAFNQGQDRSLSAMTGLGAQQYGVAQQDASQQQTANLANQGSANLAGTTNYQGAMQKALADAGYQQQAYQTTYQGGLAKALADAGYTQGANQTSYAGGLTTNQNNAGFTQDAEKANLGAGLTTNQLNSGDQLAGIGANSGLLGQAYGVGGNQDAYSLARAGQVNGLLTPYLSATGGSTTSQPLYTNPAGNILGGAMAGGALAKNVGGLLGGFTGGSAPGTSGTYFDGQSWVPI